MISCRQLFYQRCINGRGKADFGFAGFRENFQLIVAPALIVFSQDDAKRLDNLVLLGPLAGIARFNRHYITACVGALLKRKSLQRHVLGHDARAAAGLDPSDADGAAIPVFKAVAKQSPKFLRDFRGHGYLARPRAAGLRLTLLRFN